MFQLLQTLKTFRLKKDISTHTVFRAKILEFFGDLAIYLHNYCQLFSNDCGSELQFAIWFLLSLVHSKSSKNRGAALECCFCQTLVA